MTMAAVVPAPGFEALTAKIARERGFACGSYKPSCLMRRIAVRMRAHGVHDYGAYARVLDADPAEYARLLDALTINVTQLRRNHEAWDTLERDALPALLDAPGPIRAWSAGCSSGEEPYTVAMAFARTAERLGRPRDLERVSVLGTDIDERSLERARGASFAEAAFREVPPADRARWFSPGNPGVAGPALRARVTVDRRDLLEQGPPPGAWQLITCRNVIIYFDRASQDALFERFHAALAPGGVLMLGKVESLLGPARALLQPVSVTERIYRKP